MHETKWFCTGVGGPTPDCGEAPSRREGNPRSGAPGRGIAVLRETLEGGNTQGRDGGIEGEASSGTQTTLVDSAEGATEKDIGEGARSSRLLHGSVDLSTCRRGDRENLRRELPSRSCMAHSRFSRVELSETGEACERAGRSGNSTLAKQRLAPYKKKPGEDAVVSYSSTRVVLCSSRCGVELGHLVARHRSTTVGTGTTVFRQSRQSRFPRFKNVLASTFGFTNTTFDSRKS